MTAQRARQMEQECADVAALARRVAVAAAAAGRDGSREAWLGVVAACQTLVNAATAVQDGAIVEVSRREPVWCEDGTLAEVVHAPGRVALDAPDVLAPAIGASHAQAQRRVELAVRVAGNAVPVPAETRDRPGPSGLADLHVAMADGVIDGYRAAVVAHELELAPADVARAVVAALGPHLHEDPPTLRRRTRRLVSRICPDLLHRNARRARAGTGLRRWVAEPGVDTWHGTFPSEDAATAWAAIDALAHELVTAGTCSTVEQARGKALTDLVTGHATVDVRLHLTVPADTEVMDAPVPTADGALAAAASTARAERRTSSSHDDLILVHGARPSEPLLMRRGWLRDHLAEPPTDQPQPRRGQPPPPTFVPCDPLTGARLDPHGDLSTDSYRPGGRLTALVRARDGRCRFPGCGVAARFCDLDHVRPWPTGPTTAGNLACLCRRHHRVKQRPGWRCVLHADATMTWTDPTGRTRTTTPLDALETLVLADPEPPGTSSTLPSPPHRPVDDCRATATATASAVLREHEAERHRALWANHRYCTSSAQLRAALARSRRPARPEQPPF